MVTLLSALQPWVNAATSVFVVGTEKTAAIGLVADLSVLVIVHPLFADTTPALRNGLWL